MKKAVSRNCQPFLWRWRDSNSRPNEELICFLHVYLRLRLSGTSKTEATHLNLIL